MTTWGGNGVLPHRHDNDGDIGGPYTSGVTSVTADANLTTLNLIKGKGGALGVQTTGISVDASNNVTGLGTINGVTPSQIIYSASSITDTALVKGNGGGQGVQTTGIIVDGSNNVSGMGTVSSGIITTPNIVMNGGISLFNVVANLQNINMKNTGATAAFTVPAGKKYYCMHLVLHSTNVSGVTVQPAFSMGKSPGYNDLFVGPDTLSFTTNDQEDVWTASVPNPVYSAGTVVYFNVASAATATNYVLEIFMTGFLF